MNKIYIKMQKQILSKLDQDIVPWRKTWNSVGLPKNLISGNEYRGFNCLYLSCFDEPSEYWLTFKQAKKLGGFVKSGETGSGVVYYNFKEKEKKDGTVSTYPIMRGYTVFNISQCEGIEEPKKEVNSNPLSIIKDLSPVGKCEKIINNYKTCPEIKSHCSPVYNSTNDFIGIPDLKRFNSSEEYYSTLWHEAIHSTLHKSRLNRDIDKVREELVAEIGASFLCSKTNISSKVIDNQVAYISGWRKRISNDPKIVIQCASIAQKASDYILNIKKEN